MHLLYMFQDTYWVHSLGLQLLLSYQDKQQSRNFQVSQIKMKRKLRKHTTIKYCLNFLLQRSKFAWLYIWVLLLSTERQGFLSSFFLSRETLSYTSQKESCWIISPLLYLLISVSISLRCYVFLFSPASCHCEFLFYPHFIFILTAHYSAPSLLFPALWCSHSSI